MPDGIYAAFALHRALLYLPPPMKSSVSQRSPGVLFIREHKLLISWLEEYSISCMIMVELRSVLYMPESVQSSHDGRESVECLTKSHTIEDNPSMHYRTPPNLQSRALFPFLQSIEGVFRFTSDNCSGFVLSALVTITRSRTMRLSFQIASASDYREPELMPRNR